MRVIEAGHIYEVNELDHEHGTEVRHRFVFVNREPGTEHPGTQTQEVLRMQIDMLSCLIDRTNHCDACLRWEGNDRIIKALTDAQRQMRLALLYHEQRVLERKFEKGTLQPEVVPTGDDGHWMQPIVHGKNCPKTPHDPRRVGGYLHGEEYDGPYDVDGVNYCGRCHYAMDVPPAPRNPPIDQLSRRMLDAV